jgi:poly-gamma-glutamate capsule biosynthesis protein CapA/YwtB (metallophosphatase superfamily)
MRHSSALLGVAAALGIGLFVAVFFVLPAPEDIHVPYFLRVSLPQAEDREIPLPAEDPDGVTISFTGDIMLARSVERAIVEHGTTWPFAELGDVFAGSDIVVGNLEGTVRPTRNLEIVNQMSFDTTPDNLPMLKEAGFTHLSLANNHADDYGPQVAIDSRAAIEAAGMIAFGDPLDSENFIVRENIGGISISLIGFHAFGEKTTELLDAIKNEDAQGRFVIVYPHWGVEYATTAPNVEVQAAEAFVGAGADLIIGAHPHVIQNIEVIGSVPVAYSLGNFLFDQDFSTETQQGLIAHVTITSDLVELQFVPVRIQNRQTILMEEPAASTLLDGLGLVNGRLSVSRE